MYITGLKQNIVKETLMRMTWQGKSYRFYFHIEINFNISYCVCSDDPNIGWWPNCAAPIGGPFA